MSEPAPATKPKHTPPVADYSLDSLVDLQDKSMATKMKLYASPKDWRAEVAA